MLRCNIKRAALTMRRTETAHPFTVATSLAATALRGGYGVVASTRTRRPDLLLELYEYEACPYCRIVREVLTELDLDAVVYPCPRGGERFRPKVEALGGRRQFPFMHDPNTGVSLYESDAIVRYLFETYAEGVPLRWRPTAMVQAASAVAGLPRAFAGRYAETRNDTAPPQLLELYSFEASPFARPVRERLCELQIPYILRSVGRTNLSDWIPPALRRRFGVEAKPETVNRRALLARAGAVSVPYLVDPNTGAEMAESRDILAYLDSQYAPA